MKISIVIPASDKNKYSTLGDLNFWGDTTLLEWKISQAKKVKNVDKIYVTSKSAKIQNIAKHNDVKVLGRDKVDNLKNLYRYASRKISSEYILWLNCTFPFLSESTINKFLKEFIKKNKNYDSAFMFHLEKEYFFKKNKPINFLSKNMITERNKIIPLKKISNGAFIFNKKYLLKNKNAFGEKPSFFKINWLESLEIKETNHIKSFANILDCFTEKK